MPQVVENKDYRAGYYKYPNGSTSPNNLNGYSYKSVIDKPDTVRRVRPVDLFANGTPRGTSISTTTQQMVRLGTNPSYETWGMIGAVVGVGSENVTNVPFTRLDSKLRMNIKEMNTNLGQTLGEYRQAAGMFSNAAQGILWTFRHFRASQFLVDQPLEIIVRWLQKPKNRKQKDIASRWLELQYGWKPLISDIYGLTDFLAVKIRDGFTQYVNAYFREDFDFSRSFIDGAYGGKIFREEHHTWQVRGTARYVIRDPFLKGLSSMGISNPALLAWELIPYSFVVDWLIPVGNYLSALDSLAGVSNLVVQRGYKQTITADVIGYGGYGRYVKVLRNRAQPDTNLAMPRLGYQPSDSLTKLTNGLALLTQLQQGFKR